VFLRIAKTPRIVAFHFSTDGQRWGLVRYFSLGSMEKVRVGFSAQSPTGTSCRVLFSEIVYRSDSLKDIRSGQ
jgi:uncharacterized protein